LSGGGVAGAVVEGGRHHRDDGHGRDRRRHGRVLARVALGEVEGDRHGLARGVLAVDRGCGRTVWLPGGGHGDVGAERDGAARQSGGGPAHGGGGQGRGVDR